MKRKQGLVNASLAHLILWILFLLVSLIGKFTYQAPDMEPLDFALSKGIYNVFMIISVAGIVNAAVLFLSLCAVSSYQNAKYKRTRVSALCFSGAATVLFYLSAVSLFLINADIIIIIPMIWLLCVLCCGILLVLSAKNE